MKHALATPSGAQPSPTTLAKGGSRSNRNAQIARLLGVMESLIVDVDQEGAAQARSWAASIERADFSKSASNLAHYMALRRRDLRSLQHHLMVLGLSSLGRSEGRVMPTLLAVRAALEALLGRTSEAEPSAKTFFAGERRLAKHTRELLGAPAKSGAAALLVTCPTEAATDPSFMLGVATRSVQAVRINCAHDGADDWRLMIDHLRSAEAATGRSVKVFMDLAGPKIRTGMVRSPKHHNRVQKGDQVAIAKSGALDAIGIADAEFAVECTLPEALAVAKVGDRVFIDDGKLGATIERLEPWGVLARVVMVADRGLRLKPEKGLNFPDRHLKIDALTDKDRTDLAFVAAHADGVEFSFVQSAADVQMLQAALAALRPTDWRAMSLVLKIETAQAVANLPEIIMQAAGRQPTAIMIARGDLAVEIGFARTAEMQEEILWLGEACDVPVIWATQVLEHLVTKGTPSRGEMTDAAMAARSECVMLNKGPYLFEAIDQLQALLQRMDANQHKKAPRLRKLRSW
jgi:pyruvate kinase